MSFRMRGGRVWPLCFPFLILFLLPVGTLADVVLTEVLADPVSDWSGDGIIDFKADEWVEIANRGDTPADLGDYWLSDSVTDPTCRFRFSGSLAPGEHLLVTGAMAVAWQLDMGLATPGLSLSNTGGQVALFRDGAGDTLLVDSVDYLRYQVEDDRSFGRHPLHGDGWILFDGRNLYHGTQVPGSTGCEPSPGAINVCEGAAASESAWSRVKGIYSPGG
ncbi:MAG: lamin tail domain-containing protein [Candidatus Krumholzibacteriota bacterium]|nr:lamin tail domain-containing protein [Candidatus Krumholzibacteriota bacterium]